MLKNYSYTVQERFLRYVKIDTQSDPASSTFPSTEKQKDLGRLLVKELQEMGVEDAELDPFGYVYATFPSNSLKQVPVICFCSHMDTAPDCSGTNVTPVIHENYDGRDLVLPGDTKQVIRLSDYPELESQMGNDIITADGTTLLGADNKAGVADIMDAAHFFMMHPEVKHGTIRILFTPDEEIGHGVDHVDMKKLGAHYGYTVDATSPGDVENETFSADAVTLTIHGVSTHPGLAKGKLENALKIAGKILAVLPSELSPETTEGRGGFLHPTSMKGNAERAKMTFIIRNFETEKLHEYEALLENIVKKVMRPYKTSSYTFQITEQYRNMKEVLDLHPQVVGYAIEAITRAGLTPKLGSIRGGTDGSRLSFMGLPCPNIFAGEHAFHSKHEWVSVQDMHKAVDTIIHLAMLWEERS